jgi:hypothetical protein
MQNILIGVKRFLKNKNTVTIIGLIVCLGILYFVYDARIKKATNPRTVVYAKAVIGPRTYITQDMVSTKKVPGDLTDKIYKLPSDVVGKYVMNNVVIPSNGLFYKEYIGEWEDIDDTIYDDIEDNNTIYALKVSKEETYGNSIYPGNYIDLYYTDKTTGDFASTGASIVVGKFIEGIKVLAVTDGNGKNVFETAGTPGSPRYLIFSVDENLHLLLKKAEYLGATLFPVPRDRAFSEEYKDKNYKARIVNASIQNNILSRTHNLTSQDLEGIGGVN